MALTPSKLAQYAAGWTNSAYATSASTDVATAVCPPSGAAFAQSPSLVLGQFDMDCLGVAFINSLFIRVSAKSDASNPVLNVFLSRAGVQIGAIKTIPLTATLQEVTLGGDLWGTALTDADCRNLQVVCYVTALDGGTHSISYCSARADIPAGDAIPTAFNLTPQTGIALATVVTSNAITVAGTDIASCVSVANGEWEKNVSGVWSTADGSANSGDTVRVRHTSAAAAATLTATVLTIGSVNSTFNSTTTALDTIPDLYYFPSGALVLVPLLTYAASGSTVITGINGPAPVTISNGEYSINGGAYTSTPGALNNNDTLQIRCLSSGSFSTSITITVTVGGVAQSLIVRTYAKQGTFDPFFFTAQTGVPTSTLITSNTVTLTGWNENVTISITGGTYSLNGGGYISSVSPGVTTPCTISVQHTSSASSPGSVETRLNVVGAVSLAGYVASFYSVTAGAIVTPNAFAFTSLSNVENTQEFTSNTVNITGINVATPVSASNGGLVSINGGAYASTGSITNGQSLSVRLTSSAQPGYTTTTNVTVGTVTQAYSVTTDYVVNADF